jgi:hypothetical protein
MDEEHSMENSGVCSRANSKDFFYADIPFLRPMIYNYGRRFSFAG